MNVQRLARLTDFLETVPQEQFDMGAWQRADTCGTVACAGGWACTIPEFAVAGLVLFRNYDGDMIPRYGDEFRFGALAKFFGLDAKQSYRIFHPHSYLRDGEDVSPGDVARNIRELML